MGEYTKLIQDYLSLEIDTLKKLDVEALDRAIALLADCYENQRTVYLFGNGGSAATASHYQVDFNKGISEFTEKKFRFHCLNDNLPTLLALGNDIGFEEIYRFQLRGRLRSSDVLIAISGSGNSKNVINAVEYAKEQGCQIIGLTGFDGGRLRALSDVSLHVPVNSMQVTEDLHMMFDHLMLSVLMMTLCGIDHVKR